ncbi:UNKNOWN [Stylonychia lemnae]|uniref:Uncharacterized protein n=1 Tax=Stylonychia lemnae TaxID=5949 RepID=A0A077ZPJ2_STYLE|nr:UNKNOWN [Stylonychia lemnae]|eukprot:CDW71374.1 UNKNOWN [Stylonychia lemnae]
MDRFLSSKFCTGVNQTANVNDYDMKIGQSNRGKSLAGKTADSLKNNSNLLKSYLNNSQAVRPSVSFTNQSRDQVPRVITYIDLYDGPSQLQLREGTTTLNEKGQNNIYEQERSQVQEKLNQSVQYLKSAQDQLTKREEENTSALRSPKQRRDELQQIKQNLEIYSEFKQQQMFVGKRERLLKNGWRHGIVGVENSGTVGDQSQSVFYKEATLKKLGEQQEREAINRRRSKNFGISEEHKRSTSLFKSPEKVVDIADTWRCKGKSPMNQGSQNTYERMFKPNDFKNGDHGDPKVGGGINVRIERTIKLREEDQKGKQFNILNGLSATHDQWLGAYKGQQISQTNRVTIEDNKEHWKQQLLL